MPDDSCSKAQRRQAVALGYRDGGAAPEVVARGYGELADQIIAEAQRQGVYVHGAPELVALLMQLDVDQRIPPQLYQVIAELLVWLAEPDPNSQQDSDE